MNKTYFIETYGCQMNVADSELVKGILNNEGFLAAATPDSADALFVNTCAIREHAEEKVHSLLGNFYRFKKNRPEMVIGVLGCMAQSMKHDLLESKPYVDIVLGPDSYRRLPGILKRHEKDQNSQVDTTLSRFEVYEDLFPNRKKGVNAWISIMRGCDKFCSFCIVPFTRGRERSRSLDGIIAEVEQAVFDGFVEITLLGQNVNSYNYKDIRFHQLLEEVAKTQGLKRIRYTSPHPQDITYDLLITMAIHDNICNHVHLPLQAGSDRILKRMNRTYSRGQFIQLAKMIREVVPNCGISTDIIVGFPGETDGEFKKTLDVMEEIKFDSAFTFKYSPRRGTKAAEYEDQIIDKVKQMRLEMIIAAQKFHTLERNQHYVGRVESVIAEKESRRSVNQLAGRTDSNKWVIFDKEDVQIKDMVPVHILEAKGISLHGRLLKK